jgi:hypothetical protein
VGRNKERKKEKGPEAGETQEVGCSHKEKGSGIRHRKIRVLFSSVSSARAGGERFANSIFRGDLWKGGFAIKDAPHQPIQNPGKANSALCRPKVREIFA